MNVLIYFKRKLDFFHNKLQSAQCKTVFLLEYKPQKKDNLWNLRGAVNTPTSASLQVMKIVISLFWFVWQVKLAIFCHKQKASEFIFYPTSSAVSVAVFLTISPSSQRATIPSTLKQHVQLYGFVPFLTNHKEWKDAQKKIVKK